MGTTARRVLIAAEPRVLGDALAAVLRANGDEVVLVLPGAALPSGCRFDVAVVTVAGLGLAPVALVLPDRLGNAGIGWVERPTASTGVQIDDADGVLSLLDEHAPRPASAR